MKKSLMIILTSLILSLNANRGLAQSDKVKDREAYNKAWDLRRAGLKLFYKDRAAAFKLFEEANMFSPGNPDASLGVPESRNLVPALLFYYGDIRGANKAIENEIVRLKSRKEVFTTNGVSVNYIPANEWIKKYYNLRANANLTYGDAALASEDLLKLIELGFDEKEYKKQHSSWMGGLGAATIQNTFQLGQYIGFLNDDVKLIGAMQPMFEKMGDNDFITTGIIYQAILKEDYKQAIAVAREFEKTGANNRINARYLLAYSYAKQKQTAESEEFIKILLKGIRVGPQMVARINAMNALNEGKYAEAIAYANDALKPMRFLTMSYDQPGKFAYYTIRADAYAALKQFAKAKDDYERALLYNPSYNYAITGLAKLESAIVTVQKSDIIPPVITLLEPAIQRGLKVSSAGKDLMVKGIAMDPSGIKEVSVNDQRIFFKADGNFWGSIPIKDGSNKINIVVIDNAGNKAEQSFEIEKPTTPIIVATEIMPVKEKPGKNYALIIAAQNYDDNSIPSLENPVSDAIKLKLILKNNYNFADDNIYTLYNPIINDFKRKFAEMQELIQPEDNLIIFYAGHGIWVEKEQKGYWLLTDALRTDANTWLSNKLVLEMISNIPSRHTLLITDACFSGSVFKTRSIDADAPPAIRELSEKISRVAITSGNDTEVPDESVFMKYLVKALTENKDKYLTAQKMFITQIIEAVMSESKTEPRYGTLELAGHIGGDYIFTKK
ncbi:Caspase domain-containing protein [Daejeonella rubra]|uniref:Caspase domain-containing protein n=1 Tax=Daejeonella rubra TaxID=990371 RepID=A0A1G9MLI0_9SPHI|nr:caspase family protein [Daejeonella rubra]SDL74881.1 Caspase domain-containing protein [Daejeonella rubra]